MADRVSRSHRIEMQHVAEREVMRYAGDYGLWHKHCHNVDLDPVQVLKMAEMDQYRNTIDFSSRRTGKTAVKELYLLMQNAIHADQEVGIVAPREAQSLVNLGYHLEAIRRSEILSAYLAHKSGRTQLSDTKYEFMNRSRAQAYGIMAQVDGGDMTAASLEEVDDMPKERLYSRFLLMLGSTRRLGASASSKNEPQIRITGVYKGADTLTELLNGGKYHALAAFHGERARTEIRRMIDAGWIAPESVELENYRYPVPILNALNAIELGLLQREFILNLRGDLSDDEFTRQLLCVNTTSRNLVWEIYLRQALQTGLKAQLTLAEPMPGAQYRKRGLISFGYDHSGHGETPESSRSALVVGEQIGNYTCPIFARTWPPGTDDGVVKRDLIGFWRYFMPDYALGDAYGVGMLTQLCDELFALGLTTIDRRTIGEGESTASTWPEWPFAPLRFEGMVKHQMASAVRAVFHNRQAAVPYFEDHDLHDEATKDLRLMVRQLLNIRPVATKTTYASYTMANRKLGDDLFDAFMAMVWGFATRGVASVPAYIETRKKTREQLLGAA
ncbi:MAG: hypothetical protein ABR578_10085 [Chromatocurvus sp.]